MVGINVELTKYRSDATKGQFQEAMSLDGSELIDPFGKNRPMKE